MPLQSQLFRGDRALEACLVDDRAHLVTGTSGPHVKKVQRALAVLDGALIALDEVSSEQYGRSTAAAVLDYKRARNIINRSYQTVPDNIVGKMTIASLDREMLNNEARPPLRGCLNETGGGVGGGGLAIRGGQAQLVGDVAPPNAQPTVLRVAFQDALAPNEIGIATPTRVLLLSARALKLLRPFNFTLRTEDLGSFPFAFPIGDADATDVEGLRKAAQKANAGSDGTLRVILAAFRDSPEKSTGVSHGEITGIPGFKNFAIVNKERVHPDFGTLLHEMIHCSNDNLMSNFAHDGDLNSVFSKGLNRTLVTNPHVASLRKTFFA